MTDAEIESKYRALCRGLLPETRSESLLESLWGLEQQREVGGLLELTRIEGV